MLKKWTLGIALLSMSLFSHATLITQNVDATDMSGIAVTAYFDGGGSQTQLWSSLTPTVGGVDNGDWSLSVEGDTFGDYDSVTNTFFGDWTLSNTNVLQGIIGLTVNASIQGFYFDILNGELVSSVGSGPGREFDSSDLSVTSAFTNALAGTSDLFGTLDLTWAQNSNLAIGETFSFVTDTDRVDVPEPTTLFIFAISIFALINSRIKSSGK